MPFDAFDLIAFLSWPWLVVAHLAVAGVVLGPFLYIWLRGVVTRDDAPKD